MYWVRHWAGSRQVGALRAPCPRQDVGVSPGGTGSHRFMLGSEAGRCPRPGQVAWDAAPLLRGLEVPPEVVEALGGGKRPAVTITINGHSWKSRVAIMRGRYLLGPSNASRKGSHAPPVGPGPSRGPARRTGVSVQPCGRRAGIPRSLPSRPGEVPWPYGLRDHGVQRPVPGGGQTPGQAAPRWTAAPKRAVA